jgi:proteic killer suppression protein
MIQDFRDSDTQKVWLRRNVKRFGHDLQRIAHRKLLMLDAAETLVDLRIPPGNRLELLHGDREGQHSVRVDDQWRVCFVWTSAGPTEVEIVDYH